MKIKKGDSVVVIAGKDKGKSGKILRAFPKKAEVIVEGVNVVTRHQKSRRRGEQGQRVEKPMPLSIANVAFRGEKDKPVRVGYTLEKEGDKKAKKVRVSRPDGKKI